MSLSFITQDNAKWFCLEDLPNEKWLCIQDYEGLYEISNYGRVKSLSKYKNRKEFIMKQYKDKWGRYVVSLYKNSHKKARFVHRLVAQAFIPNPNNKPEVNHKRPITNILCDNRVDNLEWCTSKENSQWTIKCGNLYSPSLGKYGKDNIKSKPIVQLTPNKQFIREWENARQIDRELNIDYRFISNVCTHKSKTAKGYIFMFKEEYDEQMGSIK